MRCLTSSKTGSVFAFTQSTILFFYSTNFSLKIGTRDALQNIAISSTSTTDLQLICGEQFALLFQASDNSMLLTVIRYSGSDESTASKGMPTVNSSDTI